MAFTKITNSELNSRGATTLPNQPTISAAALKQEFDAPAKEIVAPHFNGLIDELEADTAGASIGLQAPARRTGSTVKAVVDGISQDLVTVEGKLNGVTNAGLLDAISLKHGHENKALLDTYDQTNEDIEDAVNKRHSHSNKSVLDKWSESESGAPLYNGQPMSGDMYSNDYDPDSTVKDAGGIKTYVTTGLGTKVDKVDGKGLSTNDYSNTDKNKVDTLGTSAYKNSTSVVTDSTDLVESGAVYTALQGKADNSVIAPVENGTTASQAYAVGEHFIRDGAFCTCKQAISQGGSFTLNTNYTAGDVASLLKTEEGALYDFNSNITRLHILDEGCFRYGNVAFFVCYFEVTTELTGVNTLFKTPYPAKGEFAYCVPLGQLLSASPPFAAVGISFYVTNYNEVKINGTLPVGQYVATLTYICK